MAGSCPVPHFANPHPHPHPHPNPNPNPNQVTRVSDYVPEVVAYIEQIMANGYCYEANGSVYFDTAAFTAAGMSYGKLDPSKV